jgi:hypothetical protein
VLGNKKVTILIVLSLALARQANGQTTPEPEEKTQIGTAAPIDLSKRLGFLLAAEGGEGFSSSPAQPTAYAGVKLGGDLLPRPWTWDLSLGYDRIRAQNGFSAETSGLLPVFRVPGPRGDLAKHYVRVYAGPGIGARAGDGGFGPYFSTNVLVGLFSDGRLDFNSVLPYVEYERRFPFTSPSKGDNRLKFGLCLQCVTSAEY